MVNESRLCAATRPIPLRPSHASSDSTQLSARMTATLSAELEGRVPTGLIAEIVRAIQDESRQAAQDRVSEITMVEARKRLERFIRARSAR